MTDSLLPDSGHRVDFDTGAHREMAPGKGRFDLVSPIAMRELAKLLEKGAIKYTKYDDDGNVLVEGARNWEKGLPLHSFVDSGMRHLFQLIEGNMDEDHAVAVLWNMMAFVHTREMIADGKLPKSLDDLPYPHYRAS